VDRQCRGEACSSQRHGTECIETGRHGDHGLRADPRELGITTVHGFRKSATRDQHRIPRPVARIGGRLHSAREIDAAHQRITSEDFSRARGRERVLVVDAGVLHVDDDLTRRQRVEPQIFEARGDFSGGLVDAKCLERVHVNS
jgi:hypothetical protein